MESSFTTMIRIINIGRKILSGRVLRRPPADNRVVLAHPEIVQSKHLIVHCAVLQFLPAEQIFVLVQVIRRVSKTERIIVRGLNILQGSADCR